MVRFRLSPISKLWTAIASTGLMAVSPLVAIAQPTVEEELPDPPPSHTLSSIPTFPASFIPDNCTNCARSQPLRNHAQSADVVFPSLSIPHSLNSLAPTTTPVATLEHNSSSHDVATNNISYYVVDDEDTPSSRLVTPSSGSLSGPLSSSLSGPLSGLTYLWEVPHDRKDMLSSEPLYYSQATFEIADEIAEPLNTEAPVDALANQPAQPAVTDSAAPLTTNLASDGFEQLGQESIPPNIDPELGILRVRPVSGSDATVIDPELGILRLRAIPPPKEQRSSVFISGHYGFLSGDNLLAREDPLDDMTLRVGLQLRAVPRIGRRTFLIGTAGANLLKYADHGELDYHNLAFRFGVYHQLARRTYIDLHWRNHQFFAQSGGDRFLNDHQLRISLGRVDQLTPDLMLRSSYHFQSNWSDPSDRSRLINRFSMGLSQELTSDLNVGLSYQLALIDFTQQDRYDFYHQLLAQVQYAASDSVTFSFFAGGRLGDSSHSLVDFDSTLFGLSLGLNFPLF
ncbi:MAG: hypothetical protein F6K16_39335 [Symploca sp. SIO2B6]|nr:hypothetical protein [Symploca sp. SIO2B6]